MKKKVVVINLSILILLLAIVVFFMWQIKNNADLRKELAKKGEVLKEVETANRHLKELEKQSEDLKQRGEELFKRVPVDERQPLSLIKDLINIGGETGLREVTFSIKENSREEPETQIGGYFENQEMPTQRRDFPEAMRMPGAGQPGSFVTPPSRAAQTGLRLIYLEMNFRGTYPQLLIFLEKLAKLERIVNVEKIDIQRDEKSLPYQKISLDLVTYTF